MLEKGTRVGAQKRIDKRQTERYAGRRMFQDATGLVEKLARQLRIKQTQYPGQDVDDPLAIVAFWHGKNFDRVWEDYAQGITQDAEFIDQMLVLMNQFADRHGLPRPQVA